MSREPFDRNASHINLEDVGNGKEITPEHAETNLSGFKKLYERTGTVPEENPYAELGGPEERKPGFELPKPKHR